MMLKPLTTGAAALTAALMLHSPARAQTTSSGSVGCTAVTQAATNGMTSRIGADDKSINPPQSVKTMTCLDGFFNGVGLNLVTNLLNPANLLTAVEGQICNLVKSEWNSLTLTGFNLGFGGLGGGLSCPTLSFGGGGPPIGSVSTGTGSGIGSGLYIQGNGLSPTGYPLPNVPPGSL